MDRTQEKFFNNYAIQFCGYKFIQMQNLLKNAIVLLMDYLLLGLHTVITNLNH